MFFEIPMRQWGHQIPAVWKCVRVRCTQLSKRQERNFQNCQYLLRGHKFSKSKWDPVFAKFCQRHLWKRVELALAIQVTLTSTFRSFPFSVLLKISLPFSSCQFWKSCTKSYPGVFTATWLTPSQAYTRTPVLPHIGYMTSSKLPNLSDPPFLNFFFLRR